MKKEKINWIYFDNDYSTYSIIEVEQILKNWEIKTTLKTSFWYEKNKIKIIHILEFEKLPNIKEKNIIDWIDWLNIRDNIYLFNYKNKKGVDLTKGEVKKFKNFQAIEF